MQKLIVSFSPHAHGNDSTQRNMYGVLVALIPVVAVALFSYGLGALVVLLTSIVACLLTEWVITKYLLHRPSTLNDGSALITAVLLALNLPSNLPVWMVIVGAVVAIGVGKMTFGGLGCNPFNPALVGRCFLLVSFPAAMTTWPVQQQWLSYTDAVTAATPLSLMKKAIVKGDMSCLDGMPDSWHLLIGQTSNSVGGGALGEACALAILIGLVYMLVRRIITWHIPVSILVTVAVLSGLLHLCSDVYASPLQQLLSGGLMLGAVFMATDYVTSPMTHRGQIIYGISIGVLTVVIRCWGSYPEGVSFAILIMNGFTPLINHYIKPQRYAKA